MPIDCPSAYVADGDTIRCGSERLPLLGIDAPELHRCPSWRTCVTGDGAASRRSLVSALRFGRIRYTIITRDRFGRAGSRVWAGSTNLACYQLQRGLAVYEPRWDNGGILASSCPIVAAACPGHSWPRVDRQLTAALLALLTLLRSGQEYQYA